VDARCGFSDQNRLGLSREVDEWKPLLSGGGRLKLPGARGALRGGARLECGARGGVVRVEPMKPVLKAPGSMLLRIRYDIRLSIVAFKFNLRRYNELIPFWQQCAMLDKVAP